MPKEMSLAVCVPRYFLQPGDVGEVLWSTSGPLVLQQMFQRQHRKFDAIDSASHPFRPRGRKVHTVNRSQKIDAMRRRANLVDHIWLRKLRGRQTTSGSPEFS